jgi:FkbM family methyltransferase
MDAEVLRARLGPGVRYVDIGAWIGPTVLVAAATGAAVEGFEPDPAAFQELRANVDANPELARRVTVHQVALAARAGTRMLFFWDQPGDTMSSFAHRSRHAARGVPVSVESIRDWTGRPGFDADLVKIDIEGGEYDLIRAMRPYLVRRRPDLLLSVHAYQLARRTDRMVGRGVPRRLAAHGLVLRERLKLRWLAKLYSHVYVVSANDWRPVDGATWRRLLHVPANQELFFANRPLPP